MSAAERFTTEELDRMVADADRCRRDVITLSPLADVCTHVKALAAEVEALRQERESLVADVAALSDPETRRQWFDQYGVIQAGWKVVEKIRERVLR